MWCKKYITSSIAKQKQQQQKKIIHRQKLENVFFLYDKFQISLE